MSHISLIRNTLSTYYKRGALTSTPFIHPTQSLFPRETPIHSFNQRGFSAPPRFTVPPRVTEALGGTKSNWDPQAEFQIIHNMVQKLPLVSQQLLEQFFISDMSYGALSLPARITIDAAMNMLRKALEESRRNTNGDQKPLTGPYSSSGEGGSLTEFAGTMFAPARVQWASGGFAVNVDYILNAQSVVLKLGQTAKPYTGGQLSIPKLLQNYEIAKLRGFIPPDATKPELAAFIEQFNKSSSIQTLSSPNALNKSIEELIELYRIILELNPNLEALHLKIPVNSALQSDLAGFAKVLLTAVQTYEGLFDKIKLFIDLAGYGGGTGNTKRHYQASSHSALEGLIDFLLVMSEGELDHYVAPALDGMLMTGEQIAKYQLIAFLVSTILKIKFGIGNTALYGASCEQLDRCHKPFPKGCAKGTASHHPDDLSRFDGKPSHIVDILLKLYVEPAVKIFKEFGINDLSAPPPPSEIAKMISHIPINRGDKLLERAKILTTRTTHTHAPIQPIRKISHELENEIMSKFSNGTVIHTIDKPARDFFGGALTARYKESGMKKPLRVEFAEHAGHWFGAFTEGQMTLVANKKADDSCAKLSSGTTIVKGAVGDKAGECLQWGGRLLALNAGHYFGRQAQGGRFSVCQIGAFAFEDARTVDAAFIWGLPRHYDYLFSESIQSFEKLNPHAIGKEFGNKMFSFRGFMPKNLFEETLSKGFFSEEVIKGYTAGENLSDIECELIFTELNLFQSELKLDYLHDLYNKLKEIPEEDRNKTIQSLMCKIQVGPAWERLAKT